jgi:hypothetical protein
MSKADVVLIACVFAFALLCAVAGLIKLDRMRWSERRE